MVGFGTPLTEAVGRVGSLVPVEEPLLAMVKRAEMEYVVSLPESRKNKK